MLVNWLIRKIGWLRIWWIRIGRWKSRRLYHVCWSRMFTHSIWIILRTSNRWPGFLFERWKLNLHFYESKQFWKCLAVVLLFIAPFEFVLSHVFSLLIFCLKYFFDAFLFQRLPNLCNGRFKTNQWNPVSVRGENLNRTNPSTFFEIQRQNMNI